MAARKSLSDAQQLILSNAVTHPDHGIFPLPAGFRARGAVRQKVLAALLKQGFVAERPTADDSAVWRRDARRHRFTLALTTQGARAIGLDNRAVLVPGIVLDAVSIGGDRADGADQSDAVGGDGDDCGVTSKVAVPAAPVTPAAAPPGGKLGLVLSALSGEEGATLTALVTLTGWLPHTTRAALCRLRQRGYAIRLVGDAAARAYHLDATVQG